ncbi:class II aldolase/adducin family protein [Paraglaciecola polaris]|uniref:class II aldolase/adducin family protein n=1 Tax=Paraglaciecola polaris TaxID=222814 RepID=UPI0030EB554E|tara:strand:+ start:2528 stop:3280 length:753 start_codon:yes stop_codon:yes gene_type:complete
MQSVKQQVSEQEWKTRVDLAAAYRMVAHYGWDDLVFTHISARVPGPEHHFLINPYGMMFDEVTASSLVKVDLQGNKVMTSDYDINPAGFVIHSAVHEARDDAQCVMHLHTTAGIAVSTQKGGLLALSQQSLLALSSLSYHDYEGIALNPDEKKRLVADLGTTNFMILRNHGLLTCADTIADAFLGMFIMQRSCEIQLQAQASGQVLIPISEQILAGIKAQAKQVTRSAGGALAWPGILRKLDRSNPGYDQ